MVWRRERSAVSLRDRLSDSELASLLYRGSARFLVIYVAGSAISFGVHLLIARAFGATSYGHFAYATSWMAILILGGNIGLKPTAVRYVAYYVARREWGMLRGFLRASTRWTIAASAIVVALAAVALVLVRPRLDELGKTLLLIGMTMPFMALGEVWSSATRGLGAVTRSQLPASIVQHTLLGILLVAAIGLHGAQEGAATAAGAFLLATVGTLLVSGWFLHTELGQQAGAAEPAHARSEWLATAGSNALIALFQAARAPVVVVISAVYLDAEHIAFYVAARRLANIMSLGLLGISGFASPLVSGYYALQDFSKLQRLAQLAAGGSMSVAMATALVLMAFGAPLLRLFGNGFEVAYASLVILSCGEMIAAAAGPVGYFLTMTGGQMTATRIEAAASVITVALALALIPGSGIIGAALAVAAGSVARNAWMFAAVWRRLGVRSAPFWPRARVADDPR